MEVEFRIQYDSINMKLSVIQNGKQMGVYSQFSRCNSQPFMNWCEKLPQYCFTEANSKYSIIFMGGVIFTEILKKFLRQIVTVFILLQSHN